MICFKNYFDVLTPNVLVNKLFETKDKKENDKLIKESKIRQSNLKDEIEKMPEDEKKFEKRDKVLKIVNEIIDFNKFNRVRD